MTDPRQAIWNAMSEKQFQGQVEKLARDCHFITYHTWNSQKSVAGFPDLIMINPYRGDLVVAELKTERGKLSPYQWNWLETFRSVKGPPRVFLWRPSDADEIFDVLRGAT